MSVTFWAPLRRIIPGAALALLVALAQPAAATQTPVKHLIVIFQENNSFDHYFGTYPNALNPPGEPAFVPLPNTPLVNGLQQTLLQANPNSAAPFRLDPLQIAAADAAASSGAVTGAFVCDNSNAYKTEQAAEDHGLVDQYPMTSGTGTVSLLASQANPSGATTIPCIPNLSMGYYDGNSVTALWNYANHYAMSDNFFATEFGVTVEGHINLISGQTHTTATIPNAAAADLPHGAIVKNLDPSAPLEDCTTGATITMSSPNIGDLLNNQGVTWGWFFQDFTRQNALSSPTATCQQFPPYNPHYDPFQYYATTANPHHLPPSSTAQIGHIGDQANHQYDLNAFFAALNSNNLPSVSFIKFDALDTGHPADATPATEQTAIVNFINSVQASSAWPQTAIIITYDDSDGWYDHVLPPIVNTSNITTSDNGTDSLCVSTKTPLLGGFSDRCGYGPRLPFIVISPFAKQNYIDHALIDQTSVTRFIEENWGLGTIDGPNPPMPAAVATALSNAGQSVNLAPPNAPKASFDVLAGSILGLFDFTAVPNLRPLVLSPATGLATR